MFCCFDIEIRSAIDNAARLDFTQEGFIYICPYIRIMLCRGLIATRQLFILCYKLCFVLFLWYRFQTLH